MAEQEAQMMTMMDANGRPVKIPRKEWGEKILPETLRRLKDDAEGLHVILVSALRDGFAASEAVGEGVARLQEIDQNKERSTVLRGIYLMQTGKMAEAEGTFDRYLAEHGDSGVVLANLAKLYADRGEKDRAEETLRRGLKRDPNMDSGMAWLASIEHERGGEEGYLAALRKLADEPKSWRPQLWLARHSLRNKKVDEAMELYRQVIGEGNLAADGYVQISGDLMAAGEIKRAIDLILPNYDLRKQGPITGLNLINGLAQTGRMEEAKELLKKLQEEKNPALAPLLADMARNLGRGGATPGGGPPAAAGAAGQTGERRVQVVAMPVVNPVWSAPLQKPQWLVPPKADGLKVAIFSLADTTRQWNQEAPAQEPASSRLSRALPMYLSESLRLRSSAMAICVIPVIPQMGPAVTGTAWPLAQMIEACPRDFSPDIVACGVVAKGARGARVELHLFRVKDRQPLKTLRIAAEEDYTGTALAAEAELNKFLAESGVSAVESELKAPRRVDEYLNCLDDLFIHMLAASGVARTARGEAEVYERFFALARGEDQTPLPTLAAAASVLAGMKFGASGVGNFRQALIDLVKEKGKVFEAVRRISPVIYLRLGERDSYEEAKRELASDSQGAYGQWLESLEKQEGTTTV